MEQFAIRRDLAWRGPLLLITATASRSIVTVDDDWIDVRFGIAHVRIPITNVAGLQPREWSWLLGIGIRIAGDKTLGLVGSSDGVVQIALREPTVPGVMFLRRPRNVAISFDDPAGFIAAVEQRLPQGYR